MSEPQQTVWKLVDSGADVFNSDEYGNGIALSMMFQSEGRHYAVVVTGPADITGYQAVRACQAFIAYMLKSVGGDISQIGARSVEPGELDLPSGASKQ